MFKDTFDGQTNFDPNAEFEARLGELVRDISKVGSIPKSEARRRIMELIKFIKP